MTTHILEREVKPVRNPDVQSKLLPDGHVVLFSQQNEWAHTLTPLAGIAWEYCDGELTIEEIVQCVSEAAGIQSVDEIRTNLTALFDELLGSGLLSSES
ncbi:MAG: PqqD family protein [Terriglobales bacterium]